jgi:PAS domain S-box-containing protein
MKTNPKSKGQRGPDKLIADKKNRRVSRSDGRQAGKKHRKRPNMQFIAIIEKINEGFVALDSQMNYIYINQRGSELLKRRQEDLIGKNYLEEYPQDQDTSFGKAYRQAMETQTILYVEDYYAPRDRWFENRIYPSVDGLSIFFNDITERRRAEQAKVRVEEELGEWAGNSLLHESRSVWMRYGAAAIATVIAILLRVILQPVLGDFLPLSTLYGAVAFSIWYGGVGPALLSMIAGYMGAEWFIIEPHYTLSLNLENTIGLGLFLFSSLIVMGLGEAMRRAQRYAHQSAQAAIAREQQVQFQLLEQKRVDAALRESEARLQFAAQVAQIYTWELDIRNQTYTVSDDFPQALGLSPEILPTHSIGALEQLSPPDDVQLVSEALAKAIEGRSDLDSLQYRILHPKSGETIWLEVNAKMMLGPMGTPERLAGVIQNITDRKRTEERLQLAREQADKVADRIFRLQQITTALTEAATPLQLAEMILRQGTQASDAVAGILVELMDNGQELKTVAALGYPAAAVRTEPVPLSAPTPMSDSIRTRKAVWIRSHEEFAAQYPSIAEFRGSLGNEAIAAFPLVVGDKVLGGLAFSFVEVREFEEDEQNFFLAVAQRCAQAFERARAEEVLRVSEERLRLATEAAQICAWELNIEQQTYTLGDNFAQVLGFPPDLLPGNSTDVFQRFTLPEDIPMIRDTVAQAMQNRIDVRRLQYRIMNPQNSQLIWLEVNAKLVYGPEGDPQRMFGMVQNITAGKLMEEELRASESLYRSIARSIPGGGVYVVDKDMRYLVAEGIVTNAFELSRERLEGHTVSEVFGEAINKKMEERFQQVSQGETVGHETEHSGRIYWSQYAPLMDSSGRTIIVTLDITQRKQIEEELKQSEERERVRAAQLEAIMEAAPAVIWVAHDPECQLVTGNRASYEILRLPVGGNASLSAPDGLRETNFEVWHQGRMLQAEELPVQRAARGEAVHSFEEELRFDDGTSVHLFGNAITLRDAQNNPSGALAAFVDITERKHAEEALRQLNLELESRVERRTAQLQTANQALDESRSRLQILSQRLVEVQEEERRAIARELHDRVGQSLAALNLNLTIINNQLSHLVNEQVNARLSDSMHLTAEVIALVRDVMSNLRPTVLDDYGLEAALQMTLEQFKSRYGIGIKFEKSNSLIPRLGPSIEMTLLRITQESLLNIARHAQADQVALSLQMEENAVRLTIQDNGTGIQSWEAANRPGDHGLIIMGERAEAVGGDLRISSTPGAGTQIEVRIPLQNNSRQEKHE